MVVSFFISVYAHQMVRTDSKSRTLEAFLTPSSDESILAAADKDSAITDSEEGGGGPKGGSSRAGDLRGGSSRGDDLRGSSSRRKRQSSSQPVLAQRKRQHHEPIHLTSVNSLLKEIREKQHKGIDKNHF